MRFDSFFLWNLRTSSPMWIWLIIQQHCKFSSCFDFHYRYQIDTQPPSLLPHGWFDTLPGPQSLNPSPQRSPQKHLHLQRQSHALFYHLPGIYHYLKLFIYRLQLSFLTSAPWQVLSILFIVPQPPHPTPPTNTPGRPKQSVNICWHTDSSVFLMPCSPLTPHQPSSFIYPSILSREGFRIRQSRAYFPMTPSRSIPGRQQGSELEI